MSTKEQAMRFLLRVEKQLSTKSNPKLIKRILVELNLHTLVTNNKEYNDFIERATPYSTTLFERLKLISIKPGMLNILFHKWMGENTESTSDADSFIKENKLSGWNAKIIPMQGEAPNTRPSMG